MKKILFILLINLISLLVYGSGYPVLNVVLKGGLSGRLNNVVADFKDRSGAGSWCFDYVQQTLGNIENENVVYSNALKLDITDYRISNELLEFARQEIINNHLQGTITREVPDLITGCKRVYVLTWSSKNKFGDKGNINVVKLDTPSCMQSSLS